MLIVITQTDPGFSPDMQARRLVPIVVDPPNGETQIQYVVPAFEHHHAQSRACGLSGGRESRRSATDDDDVDVDVFG